MTADSPLAERVVELEVKLSYAEDLLDTLNATVFRQQEQIELLQRQINLLARQIQDVAATAGSSESADLRDEIPPHY